MLLKQGSTWLYLTRRNYGTQISFRYLPDGHIAFFSGKVRDIDIPETEEDKKYVCILNCAKDIMHARGKDTIGVVIYGKIVTFKEEDSKEDALNKIVKALLDKFSIETSGVLEGQVISVLKKSIVEGEVDIY